MRSIAVECCAEAVTHSTNLFILRVRCIFHPNITNDIQIKQNSLFSKLRGIKAKIFIKITTSSNEYQEIFRLTMNKIDEQYFETINIQTIRLSAFASANTLEIVIENETYADERRRKIQQILMILVCCVAFNAINCMHSIFIVLNTIILIIIATQSYILANLIKCGKQPIGIAS